MLKNLISKIRNKKREPILCRLAQISKDFPESFEELKAIRSQNPNDPVIGLAIAEALSAARAVDEFKNSFQLISQHPRCQPQWLLKLCKFAQRSGWDEIAYQILQELIQKHPNNHEALVNLGALWLKHGSINKAKHAFENAKKVGGSNPFLDNRIGAMYHALGQFELAEKYYKAAAYTTPFNENYGLDLVTFYLQVKGDLSNAKYEINRIRDKNPQSQQINLAHIVFLRDCGYLDQADSAARELLSLVPNDIDISFLLSTILILKEEFPEGWQYFKYRRDGKSEKKKYDYPSVPTWNPGEDPPRSLVVLPEQGIGEQVMFSSCLKEALQLGIKIDIECDSQLAETFQRSFPTCHVKPVDNSQKRTEPQPIADQMPEKKIHMGDLPRFFRQAKSDFEKADKYLVADTQKTCLWRAKLEQLGSGPKVGISWMGGCVNTGLFYRTIPLKFWNRLFTKETESFVFVDLQYGAIAQERKSFSELVGSKLHYWEHAINEYDETIALIDALDLVVTVRTAVQHVAGALGKKVWLLNPHIRDWRLLGAENRNMLWYKDVEIINYLPTQDPTRIFDQLRGKLIAFSESLQE